MNQRDMRPPFAALGGTIPPELEKLPTPCYQMCIRDSCYNALRDDGIMVNQQGSPFYAEDATAMQSSHKRIASPFPISKVYQAVSYTHLRKAGIVRCCLKKPWNPQRIPAALCLKSCLCLRKMCIRDSRNTDI